MTQAFEPLEYVFCFDETYLDYLKPFQPKSCEFLPLAADMNVEGKKSAQFKCDICFVGGLIDQSQRRAHLSEDMQKYVDRIVEYMTGVNPEDVSDPADKAVASRTKCLALLYEGPEAIDKVRTVLGSTDPTKAEPGTVRSDFGRDLMRNGAHASDSPENAACERKIIDMERTETDTCDVTEIIRKYLAKRVRA